MGYPERFYPRTSAHPSQARCDCSLLLRVLQGLREAQRPPDQCHFQQRNVELIKIQSEVDEIFRFLVPTFGRCDALH